MVFRRVVDEVGASARYRNLDHLVFLLPAGSRRLELGPNGDNVGGNGLVLRFQRLNLHLNGLDLLHNRPGRQRSLLLLIPSLGKFLRIFFLNYFDAFFEQDWLGLHHVAPRGFRQHVFLFVV